MPANFNENVQITVTADAAPVGRAGFGVPIVGDAAGMSERVQYFTGVSGASAAQTAGDITSAQLAAITAAFAQNPRPARVGAARTSFTDVAQVDTVTVGGTLAGGGGEDFTVTINGTDFTYTTAPSDAISDVIAGLESLINAGSEPVTAADASPNLTLTADVAGDAFTTAVSTDAASGTIVFVNTTANQSVATELQAVLDENSDWYGFTLVSRADKDVRRAAEWVESANRIYVAQSSTAGVLTTSTSDIMSELQDASYNRTALLYYSDDSEYADLAWLATKLACDLDVKTTVWYNKTLQGIPVDDANVTTTQKNNAEGKNANLYLTLGSQGSTGQGKMASGRFIDVTTTVDWYAARVREEIQQLFLNASNRNSKIPFTDDGFTQVESKVRKVSNAGVLAGHFETTSDGSSPFCNMPLRSEVLSADVSARRLRFDFGALLSGGILLAVGSGYVSDDTDTITLLAGVVEA